MKRFLLFFLTLAFSFAASAIELSVPVSTTGAAFGTTSVPNSVTFVPNPAYTTSYTIQTHGLPYNKNVNNQYKYVNLTSPTLYDANNNVVSITWTHSTTTTNDFTLDNWQAIIPASTFINGSPYTINLPGTGWCVGATCAAGATGTMDVSVTAL